MKKMISEINSILSQKTKINPNDICICGLSGGQDSVLLFIILLHIKKQWNIKIKLLHFHHFWQEKNFFSTQQIWKLSFVFKNPIYIINSEEFLNTEKKAREWRQQGLERVSSLEKCNKILTGHTASDRLETALWHLIRGTSPQGLISLKWQTSLLAQSQFFSFSKFFVKKKVFRFLSTIDTTIFSSFQVLRRKENNTTKKSKIKFIYKKSKNKKLLKKCSIFSPHKKTNQFLIKKNYLKNSKINIQNVSFLIFNYCYCLYKTVFFPEIQPRTYSFVIFNLFYYQKTILRPLLVLHRNDITFFSKTYILPILSDPTNQKLRWSRNRIRHQLFPLLKFFYNPNTEYLLNNFIEISIDEQKYIESIIQKILQYWVKKHPQNFHYIKNQLQFFPKAIQRRLLQKLFQYYINLQPNLIQIEILRINSSFFEKK